MANGTSGGRTLNSFESPSAGANSDAELNPGKSSSRVFHTAVVVDFISNPLEDLEKIPSNEDDKTMRDSLLKGKASVSNSDWVSKVPRNSIVGWRIDDREAHSSSDYEIFLPFFSPHLCMPVKPGEQVWVTYENVGAGGTGYWISRKCATEDVDDLNYTHGDRQTVHLQTYSSENSCMVAIEGSDDSAPKPLAFPQGGFRSKANNTMPDIEGQSAYEYIVESAVSCEGFTPEAVPRFSKRCADLSFQGSNNTLIALGEDRGRNTETAADENTLPSDNTIPGKGTIDIVAGRSVILSDGSFIYTPIADLEEQTAAALDTAENPTVPAAIAKNSREHGEIDKTPVVTESDTAGSNINEGDPDFINDLSRVYVSMRTSGDSNLGLTFPNLNDGATVDAVDDAPYVILKSNEVRLVAKYSKDQAVNGSIRIIKEGNEDEENDSDDKAGRAVIIMQPDGTIMIDGPKIIIGSGIEKDNGAGQQVYLGRDAEEPIVLGTQLIKVLTAIIDVLDTHIHPSAAGPTSTRSGGSSILPEEGFSNTSSSETDLNKILSLIGMTK